MQSTPTGHAGFTLPELMIALAVLGVLLTIATPSLRDLASNGRMTGDANDLLRSLQLSRGEALKRQQPVVICASRDPAASTPTCSNNQFQGWIVFQDTNDNWQPDAGEEVIERHDALEKVAVLADGGSILKFNPAGFSVNPGGDAPTPTQNVLIYDAARGMQKIGNDVTARLVQIERTGRAHVSKIYSEVCPIAGSTFSSTCTGGGS